MFHKNKLKPLKIFKYCSVWSPLSLNVERSCFKYTSVLVQTSLPSTYFQDDWAPKEVNWGSNKNWYQQLLLTQLTFFRERNCVQESAFVCDSKSCTETIHNSATNWIKSPRAGCLSGKHYEAKIFSLSYTARLIINCSRIFASVVINY